MLGFGVYNRKPGREAYDYSAISGESGTDKILAGKKIESGTKYFGDIFVVSIYSFEGRYM